jgi:uncharacterized membrane protein YqjE
MMDTAGEQTPGNGHDAESHPAREMSLHLLRMLETRMDAAGIALQAETQLVLARLQLKLLSAALIFIAVWCGIVLLAIALPPDLRVPVLGAVFAGFIAGGVWCHLAAKKQASTGQVGSLGWFLDGLKLDLEVLSRALARGQPIQTEQQRSPPSDLAA